MSRKTVQRGPRRFDHATGRHTVSDHGDGMAHTGGWDRILLVPVKACAQGQVPQDQPGAS